MKLYDFSLKGQDDNTSLKKAALSTKDAPRLICVVDEERKQSANYIVFDGCVVDGCSASTTVASLTLMGCYYVFGVEYPKIYSQVLELYQTFIIQDSPFAGHQIDDRLH